MTGHYEWEINDPDVIARASDPMGREVLLISAPATSINGEQGPTVINSSDPSRMVVVVADELLDRLMLHPDDDMEETQIKFDVLRALVRAAITMGFDQFPS